MADDDPVVKAAADQKTWSESAARFARKTKEAIAAGAGACVGGQADDEKAPAPSCTRLAMHATMANAGLQVGMMKDRPYAQWNIFCQPRLQSPGVSLLKAVA